MMKKLSNFDFFIEYRSKTKNSIDDYFKKFDYKLKKIRYERNKKIELYIRHAKLCFMCCV